MRLPVPMSAHASGTARALPKCSLQGISNAIVYAYIDTRRASAHTATRLRSNSPFRGVNSKHGLCTRCSGRWKWQAAEHWRRGPTSGCMLMWRVRVYA